MIRQMEARDLEQVARLEVLCFSDPWSFALLEAGMANSYDWYAVWEQDGEIFGYGNLRVLAGEGEIERIAVLPQKRRMGLGRKLLVAMLAEAKRRNAEAVSLEVRVSNEPARALYASMGFCDEAVRKNYYRNPTEDAVIMWKHGLPLP